MGKGSSFSIDISALLKAVKFNQNEEAVDHSPAHCLKNRHLQNADHFSKAIFVLFISFQ